MQKLISNGHSLEEIKKYNLKQVEIFMASIHKIEKQKLAWDTISRRYSQADEKSVKSFLNELEGE